MLNGVVVKKQNKNQKKIKKEAGSPHPSEHLFRLTVFLVHLPNVHHGTIHASSGTFQIKLQKY